MGVEFSFEGYECLRGLGRSGCEFSTYYEGVRFFLEDSRGFVFTVLEGIFFSV